MLAYILQPLYLICCFLLLIGVNQTFSSLDSVCLPAAEIVNAALLGYIQVLLQFSHILFWQCVYVCKYEGHFLTQAAALSKIC